MIRRYTTRNDFNSHSNDHCVSFALVDQIKQAFLNHDYKFILDATAYFLVLFSSARELVRACVLESTANNNFPKQIIDMMLARIERKSMLLEAPVLIPLSIERSLYFLSRESWQEAGNCAIQHLDKSIYKSSPLLKAYAGLIHYILWQKDKIYDKEQIKSSRKIGKNVHKQRITDMLKYFGGIYSNPGVWDVPLYLHMKLLVEEENDFSAALNIALENSHSNPNDLNALVALAEFYIVLSNYESDLYSKEALVDVLKKIHSLDSSNHLMIVLCQEIGISDDTSNFIISIAMGFLDYPCNTGEILMWECLHDALTELNGTELGKVLSQEWEHRKSWWMPIHFDIQLLNATFQSSIVLSCYKALVISVLNRGIGSPYSKQAKILLSEATNVDFNMECVSKLDKLVIEEFVKEENDDNSCVEFDFSKDLTDYSEEIDVNEEVELIPIPLAKQTKFFAQEDLAAYCYVSDQCLVRQEIERIFYLESYKSINSPETTENSYIEEFSD